MPQMVDMETPALEREVRKRLRLAATPAEGASARHGGSTAGLLQPFRALGYITSSVPFSLIARGAAYFLTTCLENNFQIYDVKTLNLLFVGPRSETTLHAVASVGNYTYAATQGAIIVYERAKEVKRLALGGAGVRVVTMTALGSLLLVHTDDNVVSLMDSATGELTSRLSWTRSDTEVSAHLHPDTYVNKILIGSVQGHMELWNTQTNTLIYRFSSVGGPITVLAQSPVLDVVAIGLVDGSVILYNLKMDKALLRFQQEGRVTAIAFRTDEDEQQMVSTNGEGDMSFWDLAEGRLAHLMAGAHDGEITAAAFLPGKPVLITSGSDNAVREWTFDGPNGKGRMLRQRSGHHAPPSRVRFYGTETSQWILSAGRDRSLRLLSTVRDSQSTELSQGSVERQAKRYGVGADDMKLPPVAHFSAQTKREKTWDNVLTAHTGERGGRTWSTRRKAIGAHKLETRSGGMASTTEVSSCGHFGLLGTSTGAVEVFNMQSGVYRRTIGGGAGAGGHSKAVTGLAMDGANHQLISGSIDGTVKIWDFVKGTLTKTVEMGSAVTMVTLHRESDLAAVVCDDLSIQIVDVQTYKVSRIYRGHTHRITDMTFSPDGRWVVSASLDGTVRVWDLPTGHMVDWMRVGDICTSVTFSADGSFLATSHSDQVAVFLWANRSQFHHVPLHRIDVDAPLKEEEKHGKGASEARLPGVVAFTAEDVVADEKGDAVDELAAGVERLWTEDQLSPSMVTLSKEPGSKWQNLLNLEVIRKRNRPIEAPKAPERAPFFLATTAGVDPQFVKVLEEDAEGKDRDVSRVVDFGSLQTETPVVAALKRGDYAKAMAELKEMGPSAVDVEIRSLSGMGGGAELVGFLRALGWQMGTRRDFELVEAYLTVFLRVHGDVVVEMPEVAVAMAEVGQKHKEEWGRLEGQLQRVLCLIDFARK